jgi:hypothetical protein
MYFIEKGKEEIEEEITGYMDGIYHKTKSIRTY